MIILTNLPKPPEPLFYHTYLQTLNQSPVIAIDIHDPSPNQPEGLPIYSAAYPLNLYPHLTNPKSPQCLKAHKELNAIAEVFSDYFELYQSLKYEEEDDGEGYGV